MKFTPLIIFLFLFSSLCWSMGESAYYPMQGAIPQLQTEIVSSGNESLYVIRSVAPGQLGGAYVALWNKPGGSATGAVIVSKINSGSPIKITQQSEDNAWVYVKSAENTSLKGCCQSSQIFED